MKRGSRFTYAVLSFILLEGLLLSFVFGQTSQTHITTVKTRNNQVIKGQIKGLLVQGKLDQLDTKPGKGWGALYFFAKGEDIKSIDEEGVHYKTGENARYVLITQRNEINEIEILEMYADFNGDVGFSAMFDYQSKHNASVQIDSRKEGLPTKLKLLGEFRMENKKGRLIPALEIKTEQVVVIVSVDKIVEFRR